MTDMPTPEPLGSIVASTDTPAVNDTWTVRIVALGIILLTAIAMLAATTLLLHPQHASNGDVDSTWLAATTGIATLAATGLGALAGLLAGTASKRT